MSAEPALTVEEWRQRAIEGGNVCANRCRHGLSFSFDSRMRPEHPDFDDDGCKAIAALALHDQPFGFTWGDVEDLRLLAEAYSTARVKARSAVDEEVVEAMQKYVEHTGNRWLDLANRIAALLPPRAEDTDALR